MYLVKSPWWFKKIYPSLTWNISTEEKELFFTFDDGPHPVATPFVLDVLKQYNARATFFCIGKNVRQEQEICKRILDEGHKVANHTNQHLNGWKTADSLYLNDIFTAKEFIDSHLFRPPYGRITKFQIQQLQPVFKIIMWDVLSGDFDVKLSPAKCLEYVVANARSGSIVVFHDSAKAFERLEYALPKALQFFSDKGYSFKAIPG